MPEHPAERLAIESENALEYFFAGVIDLPMLLAMAEELGAQHGCCGQGHHERHADGRA